MSRLSMEPEEIIEQFGLPSVKHIIATLAIPQATLDKEIACAKDYHKQGNNPPSYLSVRSISEVIEDEYDNFVERLYRQGETEIAYDDLLNSFKQQLNQQLAGFVVVKNTGRAYVPDENDQTALKL